MENNYYSVSFAPELALFLSKEVPNITEDSYTHLL